MKRKWIVIVVILSIIYWVVNFLCGIIINWWFVWGGLILYFTVGAGYGLAMAIKNRHKRDFNESIAENPTEYKEIFKMIDNELRTWQFADFMTGVKDKFVINVGEKGRIKTPIAVLKLLTYHEPETIVLVNTNNKKYSILTEKTEEDFYDKINGLADYPVEPESYIEEHGVDERGRPVMRKIRLKETVQQKVLREEKKAEEESEGSLE